MKKKAKSLVALLVVLTMLGALLSGCKAATSSPAEPPADNESNTNTSTDTPTQNTEDTQEEVEITLWANQYSPENLGPQYNPIADKIAEVTGVRISVADYSSGDSKEQLATMMASNDLPDIFYVPNSDTLNSLIEAGQVLNLNEYWNDENCPNMNGGNSDAADRQRFLADTSYDGAHYAVLMWSGTGNELQPTTGFYVPWEIYREAGYPEVNSLDDLVDALDAMRSVHETNTDGQPVYGAGGWFADDGEWGSWCVAIGAMFGYEVRSHYLQNITTAEIKEDEIPITDPDSLYWQGIKFYYDLNQRGLLDPDSITQKYDQWAEKAYSGRYLMIMPGWEAAPLKQNTGMSYVALPSFGDGIVLDWSGELSGAMYAVSSTCKNPEKALQLLDYLWSPEGSRLVHSGIEGVAWEMVDGKAQFTQQRLDDELTLSKSEFVKKYGESLGQLAGYALNVVSPLDGSAFNLKYTPEYMEKTLTDAELDALNHFGVNSIHDIYANVENTVYKLGEYASVMESMPDDLSKNATDLSNFVSRNYLSCIFAADDEDFEKQKQAIIEGAADYNVEGLYAWYREAFAKAASVVDPYLQ